MALSGNQITGVGIMGFPGKAYLPFTAKVMAAITATPAFGVKGNISQRGLGVKGSISMRGLGVKGSI